MCFRPTVTKIFIAREDMVVTKELLHRDGRWITPWMEIIIPKDGILIAKPNYFMNEINWDVSEWYADVYSNAIHSYHPNYMAANIARNRDIPKKIFAKAIIPTGTKYMRNGEEYISQQIIVDMEYIANLQRPLRLQHKYFSAMPLRSRDWLISFL